MVESLDLAPLYHPVTIVLILLSVAAARLPAAKGRRALVLVAGLAVSVFVGAICTRSDWLLDRLVLVLHPVSVALIIAAAFAWYASAASRKRGLLLLFGLVLGIGFGELYGHWFLAMNPVLERQRAVLASMDTESQREFMNCIPLPYFLYAPSPTYKSGKNWHNEDGYRGPAVPLERTPGVARVLCLGGSTTYSWSTQDPAEAYPAVLERLLNEKLPQGARRVEVINGGLPNATTAELLAHYHFKFQYYAPDVVVINTGGNDAHTQKSDWKYYQPDYTHRRQSFITPQPLSPFGRTLLKSTFLSMLILPLSMPPTLNTTIERSDPDKPPPIAWHPAGKEPGRVTSVPDEQLGFTRNLRRLIQMIKADGGDVILVPFRIAPDGGNREDQEQCDRNERILKELALAERLPVAPFPLESITAENWVDSCHLNAAGCREKAAHIAPYVREVLSAPSS